MLSILSVGLILLAVSKLSPHANDLLLIGQMLIAEIVVSLDGRHCAPVEILRATRWGQVQVITGVLTIQNFSIEFYSG